MALTPLSSFRPYRLDVFGNGRQSHAAETETKPSGSCPTRGSGPFIRHVKGVWACHARSVRLGVSMLQYPVLERKQRRMLQELAGKNGENGGHRGVE
jgi:hypothetical protein